MKTKKLLLTIAALAVLGVLPSSAKADGLTFTISNPIQSGAAGSLLTFSGMMQNGMGAISDIQLADSTDALLSLTNIFFPSTLTSAGSYTGPLFEIMIDNSAMTGQVLTGSFSFTYINSQGADQQSDTQDIVVTVIAGGPAPIPEPATMILLGTGLAGAAVARRRKRRTAGTT